MQTHNPLDLSIISINYNGYADTCEMLDSIMKQIHNVSYELIIVDNASQNSEGVITTTKISEYNNHPFRTQSGICRRK